MSNCLLLAQEQNDISTILLHDKSIIKGKIIKDTEQELTVITYQMDTLTLGYRNIKKVYYNQDFASKKAAYLVNPRYFKTTGIFAQAQYGNPTTLEVGKRVTPYFYVGGQLSLPANRIRRSDPLVGERTTSTGLGKLIGIAAYSKYFISPNDYRAKVFVEGFAGVAIGDDRNTTNNAKPYGGLAIGIHIPNRRHVRFYFDLGAYTIMNTTVESIFNAAPTTIPTANRKSRFNIIPQFTVIGIEF